MPTFPRGYHNYVTNLNNAKLLEQLAREQNASLKTERNRIRGQHTAADSLTLRGIPAIGRGVAGVIPGLRPDTITDKPDGWSRQW